MTQTITNLEGAKTLPLTDERIARLHAQTNGKAWEPGNIYHPQIIDLIVRGYIERCPMRCGFEVFDTGVDWTDAGHSAVKAIEIERAKQGDVS